jgi:prepilin-type N-terminal cleavage/methylation domain-containing protein
MNFVRQKNVSGLTLVEILVVISILGILTAISLTSFVTLRKSEGLKKDTETVIEILRQARAQTLSSKDGQTYGVHLATSTATLFSGSSYSSTTPTNLVFNFNNTDTIQTVSLVGGGSDVVFKRLTGETNQSGTILFSSPSVSMTKTIVIYKTGVAGLQ